MAKSTNKRRHPRDAKVARGFGAEGIGLCRTEHIFFDGERIKAIQNSFGQNPKLSELST